MEKIMTYETLRNFTYSNDTLCARPIRGIVINFTGLGGGSMMDSDPAVAVTYAKEGIIYLHPYVNPWNWMNPQAVAYVDEILDVLFAQYSLSEGLPIVSSGGSMGGQSALVYMVYAKRTPAACVANCPVCDLPYHFTERPDLPRTLYSAFFREEGGVEEVLRKASPLHLVAQMPRADYVIFHCDADRAVNKEKHSDKFVAELRQYQPVVYREISGCGHCDLPAAERLEYERAIANAILK